MSGLIPRTVKFATLSMASNSQTLVSYSQSGKRQARSVGGHRWSMTALYPTMTRAQFDVIYAFLMKQDGGFGDFQVIPYDRSSSRGSIATGGSIALRGDETGAWLASTVADAAMDGSELVTNGDMSDISDIVDVACTSAIVGGQLQITASGGSNGRSGKPISVVSGETYVATMDVIPSAGTPTGGAHYLRISNSASLPNSHGQVSSSTDTTLSITFTATATGTYYVTAVGSNTVSEITVFDNMSCVLVVDDVSDSDNNLTINGTALVKSAAGTSTELMAYSGFTASNYLSQPYNSDLDYGTGDYFIGGWLKATATSSAKTIAERRETAVNQGRIRVSIKNTTSEIAFLTHDGTTSDQLDTPLAYDDGTWYQAICVKRNGVKYTYINSVEVASVTPATDNTMTNASAVLTIGCQVDTTAPFNNGTMALWKTGAFAPSQELIEAWYNTEKILFEASEPYGILIKVNGASQTGSTLTVDNLTVSTTGLMKAGDIFSITGNNKVYMLTEDLDSDSSGEGTMTFKPDLITSPVDNATVKYHNPALTVSQVGDVQEYNAAPGGLHNFEVDLMEVVS